MQKVWILTALLLLPGCSYFSGSGENTAPETQSEKRRIEQGTVSGSERGFLIFGGPDKEAGDNVGITVNAFLWKATLDTLSFMPLSSADPFGGTILTDWHSVTPDERFKANAFVIGKVLRSDAIRLTLFKQQRAMNDWVDVPADEATARQLENAILNRARQLKQASLATE